MEETKEPQFDLTGKSLSELSDIFQELRSDAEAMSRSKEAEAIKSAFYRLLVKLKGETPENAANPFEAVEENFKAMYADYKKERAEFNRIQEQQREENLEKKKAIIEDLKALVEGPEDVSLSFPALREIQNRWREAGPVPVTSFRDINDTYQFYVEKFYDMVRINRDLRDLDFRKNLEAKEAFCAAAEKLAEDENVVNAFHELQKLHEQWKEYGPVAKEVREDIWNRFKAATAVINKKYQAHFEGIKEEQLSNLAAKTLLCEQAEEIAAAQPASSGEWNSLSEQLTALQQKWRTIGFASRKENQKIYDRFRAACDSFFNRKHAFYAEFKDGISKKIAARQAIVDEAEALKTSTDWRATTDRLIALQKEWKEIGGVPRKKSEELWLKFRAACDEFFSARSAAEKERAESRPQRQSRPARPVKDSLSEKYRALQQEIATYENNIGFFSVSSKDSAKLVEQMQKRIDKAKAELKALELKIRENEKGEE